MIRRAAVLVARIISTGVLLAGMAVFAGLWLMPFVGAL